jgi:hypothetical protein
LRLSPHSPRALSYSPDGSFALRRRELRNCEIRRLLAFRDADQEILRAEGGCARRQLVIALTMQRLPGSNVGGIGQQDASLAIIREIGVENFAANTLAQEFVA